MPCGKANGHEKLQLFITVSNVKSIKRMDKKKHSHIQSDERFAQEEAGQDLLLDLGQVILVKSLFALLNAVLGVGQNQGHQVSLQLVTNDVQVSEIRGTHFVAAGGENPGEYGKLALFSGCLHTHNFSAFWLTAPSDTPTCFAIQDGRSHTCLGMWSLTWEMHQCP